MVCRAFNGSSCVSQLLLYDTRFFFVVAVMTLALLLVRQNRFAMGSFGTRYHQALHIQQAWLYSQYCEGLRQPDVHAVTPRHNYNKVHNQQYVYDALSWGGSGGTEEGRTSNGSQASLSLASSWALVRRGPCPA